MYRHLYIITEEVKNRVLQIKGEATGTCIFVFCLLNNL